MAKKATAHDAQLILKLYDLRREAEMRKARNWFTVEFWPQSADDLIKVASAFPSQENAWIRQVESERRKSYETDAFALPSALAGKPFTSDYLVGNKVKVKTLIASRCIECHKEGGDAEKFPLGSYEQLQPLFMPK